LTTFRSFKKVQSALSNQLTTCVDITNSYLQKIEEQDHLNAFIQVFAEEALEKALSVDKKLKAGRAGKLAGMVIGIKDNLCYKGHQVSASSRILDGFESLFSATVIERLLAEDAVIIGRLNCDEFAMGSANENSIYGTVKNPLDTSKVAGGSSGGSAAAVAAGLCLAALGSDTGGSIRQPSAFCGVVGLKPTYSRVSRYGLIAYASSFDQIGPITNTVYDSALLLEVIAGEDEFDSTVSRRKVEQYTEDEKISVPKRIAYIQECLDNKGLDPEIRLAVENKIKELKLEGNIVEPISFSYLDYLVPTYYVITTAEASSNLARFDGVHFGFRSEKNSDLESTYINTRTDGFGDEVKRRIMLGTFVLSAGYSEAYFTKAQKIRRLIKEKTNEMFKNYDFVISPTTPHTPFAIGKKQTDPTTMYLEDIFTVQANLAGNPAITIPIQNHSNGMSIGLHIMSDNFREADLLTFSKHLNKEE
jgi:aspartyl-tRNA(Asn)/glutamyl-tRNA(Gln) amidotransferase subunit A